MKPQRLLPLLLGAAVWSLIAARLLLGSASPAYAAGPLRVFGILQHDLDGDGRPDLTVIDSAFATERDFVYVYDGGGDMRWVSTWEDAVDFRNDTWLFDVGATGDFALALVFRQERGRDVAYLYDDQNGDGRVSVRRRGKDVRIEESPFWTARVESGSTWYVADGTLNHNVHVLVDGPLSRFGYPADYLDQLRPNGQPKWEGGSVDEDGDGVPEYSYTLLLAPSPRGSQLPRTGIGVNSGNYRPAPPDGFIFWPLLGGADWYAQRNYFDSPYHLTYDWQRRRLANVDLSGYPIEAGYHLNTLQYFERQRVNYADFENPMAYYDVAGDRDGRPELFIRMAYYEPGVFTPIQEVSYSWNQVNTADLRWHFKLGLLGRNAVRSVERIGDFLVQTVPHADLPAWVAGQPWDIATFVADEGGGYESSEGIYEWGPLEGASPDVNGSITAVPGAAEGVANYVLGRSASSPAQYFKDIRAGFRAEFGEPRGEVALYYSPIDRRLHLLNAQLGVWNLGDGRELRYAAAGGPHINRWGLRAGDEAVQTLWHVADQLVLIDEAGVRLQTVDAPPAVFTTGPPIDHDSWADLRRRLSPDNVPAGDVGDGEASADRAEAPFDAADPRAMFDQFAGPILALPGASLRDLRLTAGGFRFVLRLPEGAVPDVPFTRGHAPGAYVVSYGASTGYQIAPLTPPALDLSLAPDRSTAAVQGHVSLTVRVANSGLEDAPDVRVEVWAAPAGQPEHQVGSVTVAALAGESSVIAFEWGPPAAGRWMFRAQATRDGGSASGEEATALLEVQPAPPTSPSVLGYADGRSRAGLLALLSGSGAVAGVLTLMAIGAARSGMRQT